MENNSRRQGKRKPRAAIQVMDHSSVSMNSINIDRLCYVLTSVQESQGVTPTFTMKGEYKKKESLKSDKSRDNECYNTPLKNDDGSYNINGIFRPLAAVCNGEVLEDEDDYDEDSGPYICENCTALGWCNKYRSEICDNCDVCDHCDEYDSGECDGCEYSKFRDGRYYREKLDESELLSASDIEIFKSLDDETPKIKQPSKFSVRY